MVSDCDKAMSESERSCDGDDNRKMLKETSLLDFMHS